ncbi:hypothetical protein ABZ897_16165 [Nonomuraea sp. NPDC046802]|uniref:hypothetical protein n=1 Tax=Nonomuraea sp. NPDC046802 TaxID=3154919 RepID=UPI0033DB53A0
MLMKSGRNGPATAIILPREMIEQWAGRALTDDEMERLHTALYNSSIADTIGTIVGTFSPRPDAVMVAQALATETHGVSDELGLFLTPAASGNVLTITAVPADDPEAESVEGFDFCAVVADVAPDRLEEGPFTMLRAADGRVLFTPESDMCDLTADQAFQAAAQLITAAALSRR